MKQRRRLPKSNGTTEGQEQLEGEQSEALTVIEGNRSVVEWTPGFVTTVDEAVAVVRQKREFLQKVMVEGTHYGKIPGAGDKPVLLLPGAQTLSSNMALHPIFGDASPAIEDWTGADHAGEPFLSYRRFCELRRQTGLAPDEYMVVARAEGSCNSWESKYRYRSAGRSCPNCGKTGYLMKSKPPRTGYYCWNKPEREKHGCGAQFREDDKRILEQVVGRVPNPDVLDQANTMLKMADKRAYIAATLQATGCADLFTQDLEELERPSDDLEGHPSEMAEGAYPETKKEVKPSQPTQTSAATSSTPVAPSTQRTPSSEAKSQSPAATPTAATSPAPTPTTTAPTPTSPTTSAAATSGPPKSASAASDPNASGGAATASPSQTAASPSSASAEPAEVEFGEAQSDTAKALRAQALELAVKATRLSAERRQPNDKFPDSIIEAKAKAGVENYLKMKRNGVTLEQATSEDLMALIEAIQVTLNS